MTEEIKHDLQISAKWAALIKHCAYRGKTKLNKSCSHLFSLSGKCKLNYCPIVQPEYVTFQLDEGNNLLIMIEKVASERISDNWIETEFDITDEGVQDKARKTINKYPAIRESAERKFQTLYTLGRGIAESMSEETPEEED
ncbi:MAG: hypothetical protein ACFFD4_18340 [Candidatus Odinarchaeota archaeon]